MRIINFLLLGFIIIPACTSENAQPDPSRSGPAYFPLEKGQFRIYDIQSVEYLFTDQNIERNYQLKEVVADTFRNLEGGISYRIERYFRENEADEWEQESEVWSARINDTQAIQVEENISLLKLVFPLRENKKWDAHALTDSEEDEYEMVNLFQPFPSADSVAFEKTITVIQEEVTENILFRDIKKEVYGYNIGLVHKEITELEYCADNDCLGQSIIESGLEYRQHLVEYGKE